MAFLIASLSLAAILSELVAAPDPGTMIPLAVPTLAGLLWAVVSIGRRKERPGWVELCHTLGLIVYGYAFLAFIAGGAPKEEHLSDLRLWPVMAMVVAFVLPRLLAGASLVRAPALTQGVFVLTALSGFPFTISLMWTPRGIVHLWGVLCWTLARLSDEQRERAGATLARAPAFLPLGLLLTYLLVTLPMSACPWNSLLELTHWGLVAGGALVMALDIAFNGQDSIASPDAAWARLTATYWTGMAALITAAGAWQIGMNYNRRGLMYVIRERLWVMSMHPNIAATVTILAIGLAWWSLRRIGGPAGLAARIGVSFGGGAIFLTCLSRGALFGLAGAALVEFVLTGKSAAGRRRRLVVAGVLAIVIGGAAWSVARQVVRQDSYDTRAVAWQCAAMAARERPLFGQGIFNHLSLSRFGAELPPRLEGNFRHWMSFENRGAHAHGMWFESAQSMGLIGTLLLAWLVVLFWWRGYRSDDDRGRTIPRVVIGGFLLHQTLDCTFFLSAPFMLAGILAVAAAFRAGTECSRPPAPWAARLVLHPVALLLAAVLITERAALARAIDQRTVFKSELEISFIRLLQPLSPNWPAVLANRAFLAKDFGESILWFQAAARLDPLCSERYTRIGAAALQAGDHHLAMVSFETAIALDPLAVHDDEPHLRHCDLLREEGKRDEFLAALGETLLISPRAVAAVTWREPLDLRMPGRYSFVRADDVDFLEMINRLYEDYERIRGAEPERAAVRIRALQEVLWRAGKFKGLATLSLRAGLSPVDPVKRQSEFISARRIVSGPGAVLSPEERRRRYDAYLVTGKEQAAREDFDRSLASFLLAAELLPAEPETYRLLAGLCDVRNWRNEADYFRVLAGLSGE